ncbi:hypothetical protein E2C01_072216 [Portunus trituberculatus]|uniref:Uncharacterized protein n=1 Tax=Portunus trituberculatus TaxID=210409 RepID=A0A5B7HXE5_PORTR|nr:hypothetical protein [Portunus trituberculatus]
MVFQLHPPPLFLSDMHPHPPLNGLASPTSPSNITTTTGIHSLGLLPRPSAAWVGVVRDLDE